MISMMMIIIAVGYSWSRLSGSDCRIHTFEYCVNLSIGIWNHFSASADFCLCVLTVHQLSAGSTF